MKNKLVLLRPATVVVLLAATVLAAEPAAASSSCDPASATCLTSTAGAPATTRVAMPSGVEPRRWPPGDTFPTLQLNLCNSGRPHGPCTSDGKSVVEAAGIIKNRPPDLVTLNEVCESDVHARLFPVMRDLWPNDVVFSVFMPVVKTLQPQPADPVRCIAPSAAGDRYGIGMIGHVPAGSWAGWTILGGWYGDGHQFPGDEKRAFVCAHLTGNYYGCTTHLTNDDDAVALRQCNILTRNVIPAYRQAEGNDGPTIAAGDLNLVFGGAFSVQQCVPAGHFRKGDGDVQHFIASNDLTFLSRAVNAMQFSDHPFLRVSVRWP